MNAMNDILFNNIKFFENITSSMMENFAIPELKASQPDSMKFWEDAASEYQNFCNSCLHMSGFVLKEEYKNLAERYEDLKKKCAEQEKIIRNMKRLENSMPAAGKEIMTGIEHLFSEQNKQFEGMLKGSGLADIANKAESEEKEKKPAKKSKTASSKKE